MQANSGGKSQKPPHRIELNLQNVNQLFNTMDPSPFHEKDLDAARAVLVEYES